MLPITRIQVERVASLLGERGASMELSDEALSYLAEAGYDPAYGARPLKRVIQRELQDPLSELLIQGKLQEGQRVRVTRSDAGLGLEVLSA
jgi:ATP-dependent Clp protease ATP-binding subunit ClpB